MGVLERKVVEEAKAEILAALGGVADQETVDDVKSIVEGLETSLSGSLTANVVKSVQRGVITIGESSTSATATINAVNIEKASVSHLGSLSIAGGNYSGDEEPTLNSTHLTLTNSTTVTANRGGSGSKRTVTVSYEVVEFY